MIRKLLLFFLVLNAFLLALWAFGVVADETNDETLSLLYAIDCPKCQAITHKIPYWSTLAKEATGKPLQIDFLPTSENTVREIFLHSLSLKKQLLALPVLAKYANIGVSVDDYLLIEELMQTSYPDINWAIIPQKGKLNLIKTYNRVQSSGATVTPTLLLIQNNRIFILSENSDDFTLTIKNL